MAFFSPVIKENNTTILDSKQTKIILVKSGLTRIILFTALHHSGETANCNCAFSKYAQLVSGQQPSWPVSALTFTPECLPRRCCKTSACVCVSQVHRRHLQFLSSHISTQQLSQTKTKKKKKKSPSSCHTQLGTACLRLVKDNQDGVYTAAGRSSLAVFGLWPPRALLSSPGWFSKRGAHFQDAGFIILQSCEGAQEKLPTLLL